jgi:biopolymer transport protein ExbD
MALKNTFARLQTDLPAPVLSMAPLIDMVFLLLIFFVVTTTFTKETGILVNKARAQSAALLKKEQLIIQIDRDGNAWLGKQRLAASALVRETQAQLARNPQTQVIVVPDKDGRIEPMVTLLDELRLAGITSFAIGTEKTYGK